jgi:hypothetical protein
MATPTRHTIEVFSAGCSACEDALKVVREIAGTSHQLEIRDMRADEAVQERARRLGIHRVPAVVVNGTLAQCCQTRAVDASVLRSLVGSRA